MHERPTWCSSKARDVQRQDALVSREIDWHGDIMESRDTIFALSSGLPPAGIAVVRISGANAAGALVALAGRLPAPRVATLCRFRDGGNETLDHGLALWFPGPASVTGEDLAELHLHGGRAVVAAVLAGLNACDGLRPALAGEFTRRAFENGRIDLSEAEGLADLLAAETEAQRRSAQSLADGGLGRYVEEWQMCLLRIAARVEADLDFSDEGDVSSLSERDPKNGLAALSDEMVELLTSPPAERLREGVRIVFAGPPNVGKSSVFNAIAGRPAAIVTSIAGTTRDRIEAPVVIDGLPLLLIDTAGLRDDSDDVVEAMGMQLSQDAMVEADILVWMGAPEAAPGDALLVAPKSDLGGKGPGLAISTVTCQGLDDLRKELLRRAHALLPRPGTLALNVRHRSILGLVVSDLKDALESRDGLIIAEHLRHARTGLDALTGRAGVEDMLDALFGAFCIGK
jgi:tRNA modification GTPase